MPARERSRILMRAVSKSKHQSGGVEAERAPRSAEVKRSWETSTSDPGLTPACHGRSRAAALLERSN